MQRLVPSFLLALSIFLASCGAAPPSTGGPPLSPTDVTTTPGPGYITVQWQDNSDNEAGFAIYRNVAASAGTMSQIAAAQGSTPVGEAPRDATSFVDVGVTVGESYTYSVIARGDDGDESDPALQQGDETTVEAGVDLMVGTSDRPYDDGLGTVVVVYFVQPQAVLEDDTVSFDVTITGPSGWNDGEPIVFSESANGFARDNRFAFIPRSDIDAVGGTFSVTLLVGTQTYTASAGLEQPDFKLGPPTGIHITNGSQTEVAVEWDPPPGSRSAWVSLWRGNYEERVAPYERVAGSSHVFTGLDLESGLYQVEVVPVNVDITAIPVKTEPFGLSYDTQSLAVGDAISPECSSADQVIPVPDANLKAALHSILGSSGDISCGQLASLTHIDIVDDGIASLEGLQYAVNLNTIEGSENDISDLSPIANLPQIQWLNLNLNNVSDLTPLQNLGTLRGVFLCCDSNAYTDISPLANLTDLEYLDIGGHDLGDLAVLAGLDALEFLWAWGNDLEDADMQVFTGKRLRHLNINGNRVSDVSFLVDQPELVELYMSNNEVTDISVLADLPHLDRLDITHNSITDITPLVENSSLGDGSWLRVQHNYLDLDAASSDFADIEALLNRGVDLEYDPQQSGAACAEGLLHADSVFFGIDSRSTYLETLPEDDAVVAATSIDLAALSIAPGDCLGLETTGAYRGADEFDDDSGGVLAVFANDAEFLAAAGTDGFETYSCLGDVSTYDHDIPEDFQVFGELVFVEVPAGATMLLFSPPDCYFGDNSDPNSDYGVKVRYHTP